MYEEVANTIYEYYKENNMNDEKYIREIYDVILNYMGLNNYVKGMVLKDQITNPKKYHSVAKYFSVDKVVEIYLGFDKVNYGLYPDLYDDFSKSLYFNINVAHTIFHELDHAKYFKEYDNGCNDILHELSKCGIAEHIASEYCSHRLSKFDLYKTVYRTKRIYQLQHDVVPIERRAIYTSLLEIEKVILELLNYDVDAITLACFLGPQYYNEIANYKKYYKLKNCGVTNSPSYEYCNYVGYKKNLKPEELLRYNNSLLNCYDYDSSNYSFEERIKYGLQLSDQELEFVINKNQAAFDDCRKILVNQKF